MSLFRSLYKIQFFIRLAFLVGCSNPTLDANDGRGVIPETGTLYESGERILLPDGGLSFTIPDGYLGEGDRNAFVIGKKNVDGLVIVRALEAERSAVEAEMKGQVQIEDVLLTPKGSLHQSDDVSTMEYGTSGKVSGLGIIKVVHGSHGFTGLAVGLATQANYADFKSATEQVVDSMTLEAPIEENSSSSTVDWKTELSGYSFVYYESGDGYTIEMRYRFCSDSTAYYKDYELYTDFGGDLDEFHGNWEILNASGNRVDLRMTWQTDNWDEQIELVDGKFFIDGSKWFREPAGC